MKRLFNINTFLVLAVMFILVNIFVSQYAKIEVLFRERNILKQCIIIKFGSNYALVRNNKVLMDSNTSVAPYKKDGTIMVPLKFFLSSLREKYFYNNNNDSIVISYSNKKIQINKNLDIHIIAYKINQVLEYNSGSGEYSNSIAYLPLPVLAEFFGKTLYERGNFTIISDSNKLGDIDMDKLYNRFEN